MARFIRTIPAPVIRRHYAEFRPYVRNDFEQCCAYCYLHEFNAHGEENFQLDHFRPKANELFPHLINDFYNIYYACSVCNRHKRNYWPSDEDFAKGICFVDLCTDDFEQHYELLGDGRLNGLTDSANYTIDRVKLNRPHLIKKRERLLREGKPFDKEPE